VLPTEGQQGWLGGDADVSVVIGGPNGRRALWIFADTYISFYHASTQTREAKGLQIPHNTVGLVDLTGNTQVQYYWKTNTVYTVPNSPVSFFYPDPEVHKPDPKLCADSSGTAEPDCVPDHEQKEYLWPVAGIASRDGRSVALLATRTCALPKPKCTFMQVLGTALIVLPDVASEQDPRKWKYTVSNIGSEDLSWFSSIFFANPEGDSDSVYIFGHQGANGKAPAPTSNTVLARASLADLLEHKWERTEYWVAPGKWSPSTDSLQALGVPSWETTCTWSKALGMWYSFHIVSYGSEIFLWTAAEITGTWSKMSIYNIPAPFNTWSNTNNTFYSNYAAKSHPELANASLGEGATELILSYITNWAPPQTQAQGIPASMFSTGKMEWSQRAYWPRFIRVEAHRS